ncbi:YesL family protein [Oceanobacillus sp. Castelsardo]|uniref:YesL family protein n=1 Tax=Oceanobacillus sp. Castelsardo TaxID=1851204 RepID=UPI000838A5A0|nr:DUF624 domain-containing protein [Oceanobacillus sp. Castelsardo]
MKYSGFMRGVYAISMWVMRFSVINLLWLLFQLPIIFILVSILYANSEEDIVILLPILIILIPFLFFPATQSMFSTVRDWLVNEEEKGLIQSYIKYYKENYKKSMKVAIILTIVWVIWGFDFYYFSKENVVIMFMIGFLGLLLYVYTVNAFSLNAHFHLSLAELLKRSLIISIGSPVLTLIILLSNFLVLVISIYKLSFLIPFFTGTLITFLSFSAFYRQYVNLSSSKQK